jgi:hypothetical protein
MFLRIPMMYIRTNIYCILKRMDESKVSRRSYNLLEQDIPSLLTIIHDEIETVIPSESN